MRDKLSCNSEMICAVRAVKARTKNRNRTRTKSTTTVADKRCAGPCLFRTCAGLHWGNQPARVVAQRWRRSGSHKLRASQETQRHRCQCKIWQRAVGNLRKLCAADADARPGLPLRLPGAVQSLECSHVLMANGVNENRQHQHSLLLSNHPFAAKISTWQLAAVAH